MGGQMAITALAYLGVRSDRIEDWSGFAASILGMQVHDRGGRQLSMRMDDQVQRLMISDEPGETLAFIGWEVETTDDLAHYAARLEDAGHAVTPGSCGLADRRRVAAPGLLGGEPGRLGANTIVRADGSQEDLGGAGEARVAAGDAVVIRTPTGGGFGSPEERKP